MLEQHKLASNVHTKQLLNLILEQIFQGYVWNLGEKMEKGGSSRNFPFILERRWKSFLEGKSYKQPIGRSYVNSTHSLHCTCVDDFKSYPMTSCKYMRMTTLPFILFSLYLDQMHRGTFPFSLLFSSSLHFCHKHQATAINSKQYREFLWTNFLRTFWHVCFHLFSYFLL